MILLKRINGSYVNIHRVKFHRVQRWTKIDAVSSGFKIKNGSCGIKCDGARFSRIRLIVKWNQEKLCETGHSFFKEQLFWEGGTLELEPGVHFQRFLRAIAVIVEQLGSGRNVFFRVDYQADRINRVLHLNSQLNQLILLSTMKTYIQRFRRAVWRLAGMIQEPPVERRLCRSVNAVFLAFELEPIHV